MAGKKNCQQDDAADHVAAFLKFFFMQGF